MDLDTIIGMGVRGITVGLGLITMIYMFRIRARYHSTWNRKMKDIWWIHLVGVYGIFQANLEHLYQYHAPTYASGFFIFALLWTIKGIRNGDMYVRETPVCVHPDLNPDFNPDIRVEAKNDLVKEIDKNHD